MSSVFYSFLFAFSFLIISIDWKEYDHFENNEILLLVPPLHFLSKGF